MQVRILTPEKQLPEQEATHVTLPACDGEVGIRPGHAPYLFLLGEGRLEIGHDSQAGHTYALKGGIAQVERDVIEVLAESVVDTEDLTETDLLKQLQDMDAADYDDDFALAEAKSKAHWIVTQLKTAGKQVPELTKLK